MSTAAPSSERPRAARWEAFSGRGVCFVGIALLLVVGASPVAAQEIRIRKPKLELGDIIHGSARELTVEIENPGDKILRLEKILPSCSCLRPAKTLEVPAGGSAKLVVGLDSSHLAVGDHTKSLQITSNAPSSDQKVQFVFRLLPLFQTATLPFRLSGLPGQTIEKQVELRSAVEEPLQILGVGGHHGKFTAELLSPTGQSGKGLVSKGSYTIQLTAAAHPRPATFPDDLEVKVRMASGEERTVALAVHIEFRDRIQINSGLRGISFTRQEVKQLVAGKVEFILKEVFVDTQEPDYTFKILSVEVRKAPPETFTVTWEPVDEGRRYRLDVKLSRVLKTRVVRSEIVITTDDPEQPVRTAWITAHFPRR